MSINLLIFMSIFFASTGLIWLIIEAMQKKLDSEIQKETQLTEQRQLPPCQSVRNSPDIAGKNAT